MSGYHIVVIQATAGRASQAPQAQEAQAAQGADLAPTREQLRNQIRQSIQEATRAAAEARASANEVRIVDGQAVIAGDPAATPTTIQIHRDGMQDIIPPQAVDISIAF